MLDSNQRTPKRGDLQSPAIAAMRTTRFRLELIVHLFFDKWYTVRLNINMECKNCNKVIKAYRKFCSQSCSASYNNRHRKKTFIKCLNCEKDIHVYPNQIKYKKFCCTSCSGSYRSKHRQIQQSILIEKGEAVSNHVESNNAIYRKYLIDKHGAACMKCGWDKINQHTNKVPIEMNHIDGNSTNTCLENLELLCPNCHSLTSTHKGANKSTGGSARYQMWRGYFKS